MNLLIGIDDTDNKESRGTGFIARQLVTEIIENSLADVLGVTRHQHLFDPRIPYTSHNSSACIELICNNFDAIKNWTRKYLLRVAAIGSDVGLCIAERQTINKEIVKYAEKTKKDIVTQKMAKEIAAANNIYLEGLTGTFDGIIGSLGAVGLHASGNDGRFIWLKGKDLREINGTTTKGELLNSIAINDVVTENYTTIKENELILLGEWVRPILKNNKILLIVEEVKNEQFKWKLKSKDFIKNVSN